MVIPSLVFFLCLFSAALTPKDTPSVDASVMKKWVEDNRKTDSYMVYLSGGSVKKKKQAIPQGLYRKIEIGDQVKLNILDILFFAVGTLNKTGMFI